MKRFELPSRPDDAKWLIGTQSGQFLKFLPTFARIFLFHVWDLKKKFLKRSLQLNLDRAKLTAYGFHRAEITRFTLDLTNTKQTCKKKKKNIHIFREVETHELEIHIVVSNRLLFHSQSQASASLEQKLALNHCFHPGSNLAKSNIRRGSQLLVERKI